MLTCTLQLDDVAYFLPQAAIATMAIVAIICGMAYMLQKKRDETAGNAFADNNNGDNSTSTSNSTLQHGPTSITVKNPAFTMAGGNQHQLQHPHVLALTTVEREHNNNNVQTADHFYRRVINNHADATLPRKKRPLESLAACPTMSLAEALAKAAVHCRFDFQEAVQIAEAFGRRMTSKVSEAVESPPLHHITLPEGLTGGDIATMHVITQDTPLHCGLNGALGGWGAKAADAMIHYMPYAKLLSTAFAKLPRYSGRLFRGVRLPIEEVLGGKGVGDVIELCAFTFTSTTSDALRDRKFLGIGDLGDRAWVALPPLSLSVFIAAP